MRIGARQSGFSVDTLRYYERVGLLPEPTRTENGYRSYDETTMERLRFIRRSRNLGLDL